MSKGPMRFRDPEGHALRKVYLWISEDEKDVASSPVLAATSTGIDYTIQANLAAALDIADSTGSLMIFDTTTGDLAVRLPDSVDFELGTGADDSVVHNGTNSIWTHKTGNLIFDNQLVTGASYFDLGTDTSATEFAVRNDSGSRMFKVDGAGDAEVAGSLLATGGITGPTALIPVVADPGTGNAIPVTGNASIAITSGAGGETNTLAIPTFAGQVLSLTLDVDGGGDRVITVAGGFNQTGNNTITLDDAGDNIVLIGVQVAGAFVWRVLASDGAGLTTV